MSTTDEITEVYAKGIACVSHCPLCGVELEEVVSTNRYWKCLSCDGQFQVKTKSGE